MVESRRCGQIADLRHLEIAQQVGDLEDGQSWLSKNRCFPLISYNYFLIFQTISTRLPLPSFLFELRLFSLPISWVSFLEYGSKFSWPANIHFINKPKLKMWFCIADMVLTLLFWLHTRRTSKHGGTVGAQVVFIACCSATQLCVPVQPNYFVTQQLCLHQRAGWRYWPAQLASHHAQCQGWLGGRGGGSWERGLHHE